MRPESDDPFDREDAPFLSDGGHGTDHDEKQQPQEDKPTVIDKKLRFRLMVTLFTMVLAVEVGFVMANGPMTRIYESIACREYYAEYDPSQIASNGQVDEELCKIKEIQSELAAVKGYGEFFDGIFSVLLAIPYGLLADRQGRKPTICLSIPGFALNCIMIFIVTWFSEYLPLRAVWVSSLAWLLGGGPVVAVAIIWTMMCDVTTEDERASMFFKFGVASMGADFVSSAASSYLMELNPWLPLLIGWGVVIVGVFFALSLPETMHALPPDAEPSTSVELSRLSNSDFKRSNKNHDDDTEDEQDEKTPFNAQPSLPFLGMIQTYYRKYLTPYTFIFRNNQILLLLTAFLVYRLSRGSSWFLVQYISTRYAWTLAQANFLISFKPALTIPLFLFVLPGISKYILRGMKQLQKDLHLARASIVCLALGTLGIGLSPSVATLIPSLILQTSGSGFVYLTRSLITTLVKREETARLFTIIEVLQSVGNVIASLSITAVFQIGLELGGMWIGLAWMMTSTAFTLVGLSIWLFRLPPSVQDDAPDGEGEVEV